MTIYVPRTVECAHCGQACRVGQQVSWLRHGPTRQQLESRLSMAPRGLDALGLHRCMSCGHAAMDLTIPLTREQQSLLQRFDRNVSGPGGRLASPDMAGLLLHAAYRAAADRHAEHARALMQAVWLLDDWIAAPAADAGNAIERARLQCIACDLRRRAAAAVESSMTTATPLAAAPLGWAVHADLLRRAGDHEEAASACRAALEAHVFDSDELLTVRDRLSLTLILASARDGRAAWVDEAEALAPDHRERLARRQVRQLLETVGQRADSTIARRHALAKVAPLRLVDHPAVPPAVTDGASGLPGDWPLPNPIRTLMLASARAYDWPAAALGPILVGALARVLGDAAAPLARYLAGHPQWLGDNDEVAYMTTVLRRSTPQQWDFAAPAGGFRRGAGNDQR